MSTDGRGTLALCRELRPDVLLLDSGLTDPSGLDVVLQLSVIAPLTRVLLTSRDANRYALAQAMQVGAHGFLLKQQEFHELREAIRTVAKGRVYVPPKMRSFSLWARGYKILTGHDRCSSLTPRQREVLHLIAEGLTSKEIAALLHISAKTVEFHRSGLMDGLGLRTVAALTRFAIETGMVRPADS